MYCNVGVIYYNAAEVHGLSGKSALFSIVIIAMSRWITRVIFSLKSGKYLLIVVIALTEVTRSHQNDGLVTVEKIYFEKYF